jgi:uncharacterized protein (TIGR02600 family)
MKAAKKTRSGSVLVMVAGALAIMMILLLALLQSTSSQSGSAQSAAALAREKMLADSAVALVIGQIEQASTKTGQAWISQPGLLRTYDATTSRKPTGCYKLYSTPTLDGMLDTSGKLDFYATDIPAGWNSELSLYTDLNAPAPTAGGQPIYPILDPAALAAETQVTGVSSDNGAVTMPVAWLYQLQDGSLGPAANATAANPIVARIAFWTDDETSKIDINTAGCGTPWNVPHLNSTDDIAWSTTQPAAGEFSAYPGHPATTSLAVVFGAGSNPLSPQQLLGLSPRYAWGGSQFGAQPTTPGESIAPKTDRLYASLDELCFGTTITSGQRQTSPITPAQIENTRFVLTAHSVAPETTLLGEPRIAIWPISDAASPTAPGTSATDRAIVNAATIGTRAYYFQRNNPLNAKDDFDPGKAASSNATASNVQLFNDLLTRGTVSLPGYGASFTTKYPDPKWTQIVLEITDFIRALNPIDINPAVAPFAHADSTTSTGLGFIDPLTWTYGTGADSLTLRGFGRSPTLSSLTIVFYVSGFGFKDGTYIDFDETPDLDGSLWTKNFAVSSTTNRWKTVNSERVRAFIVPCTFHPGCGYPEISDACQIQITGLDGITVTSGGKTGGFGFSALGVSSLLGTPLKNIPTDRAYGGNEGPLVWNVVKNNLSSGGTSTYAFAGATPFALPLNPGALLDSKTGGPSNANAWARALTFNALNGVKVTLLDRTGTILQTLNLNFPAFSIHAPTINGECDYADDPTLKTNPTTVSPSWYMNLQNRLRAGFTSRALMIQAGDISRSVEAATDLRVIAALPSAPASMFKPHPGYLVNAANIQGGSHAHNLRFADGTSAAFALGNTVLDNNPSSTASAAASTPANNSYAANNLTTAQYPSKVSTLFTVTDWNDGKTKAYYNLFTAPPCSAPTGSNFVTMVPVGQSATPTSPLGDWDTGPGFAPDGAQIGMPDSGTSLAATEAYFSLTGGQVGGATQRTPNMFVPSPVIFGSLPAGIDPRDSLLATNNPTGTTASQPWRTLLFCPYPAASTSSIPYTIHPGTTTPPDHLILDNFWMPVVEPYAISTCMATSGKINLNDQIAPFTYLHRSTALRALLASLRIPAIPLTQGLLYKSSGAPLSGIWNPVDADATVAQIENKFANASADAYLSESEICTVPLVPKGQAATTAVGTQAKLLSFWNGTSGGLTGDNLRELPYAQLYGRLTTRSNSYTVHVRVQVLQKLSRDPNQNVWNEGVDLVLSDWRGSYEIERYLDPAAKAPTAGTALGPYKFRILSARQFTP